jgi:glycolate oxidase FAD binding subunit
MLVEWGGALRWMRSTLPAETMRAAARDAGGHATLFRRGSLSGAQAGGIEAAGCFSPLDPALLRIHQRLKAEFDPAGVFNHGRLYPGL